MLSLEAVMDDTEPGISIVVPVYNSERTIPDLRQVMLAALKNVRPSHLLDIGVAGAWSAQAGNYPPRA